MNLNPYVDDINRQLAAAAQAGGEEARSLAERLAAPLDAAFRLALQDVLAAAAEEITCDLAPGSVELRLRGRNPEFVVTPPPVDTTAGDRSVPERDTASQGGPVDGAPRAVSEADDGEMLRINLRMSLPLKTRIEQAAGRQGLSVNNWLVRAASAALERGDADRQREPRAAYGAKRYTGWAR